MKWSTVEKEEEGGRVGERERLRESGSVATQENRGWLRKIGRRKKIFTFNFNFKYVFIFVFVLKHKFKN